MSNAESARIGCLRGMGGTEGSALIGVWFATVAVCARLETLSVAMDPKCMIMIEKVAGCIAHVLLSSIGSKFI